MHENIGLKIYPNNQEFERIHTIAELLPKTNPLEIGFYTKSGGFSFGDTFIKLMKERFWDYEKKIIHLSTRTTVFTYGIEQSIWRKNLSEELDLAQELGAEYCVIHDCKWTPSVRKRQEFIQEMAKNAKIMAGFSPLPLYMENTFCGVDFYREAFKAFDYCLNFTFDVGHTRVWSEDSYEEWFSLMETLDQNGVNIHFHIHSNRCVFDEHLAFTQIDDPQTVAFIKQLMTRFPQSNFILEIQTDFRENLELFATDFCTESV